MSETLPQVHYLTDGQMDRVVGGSDLKPSAPNEQPREFVGPPYIPRPANPFESPPTDLSDLSKATSDISCLGRVELPIMLGD